MHSFIHSFGTYFFGVKFKKSRVPPCLASCFDSQRLESRNRLSQSHISVMLVLLCQVQCLAYAPAMESVSGWHATCGVEPDGGGKGGGRRVGEWK